MDWRCFFRFVVVEMTPEWSKFKIKWKYQAQEGEHDFETQKRTRETEA